MHGSGLQRSPVAQELDNSELGINFAFRECSLGDHARWFKKRFCYRLEVPMEFKVSFKHMPSSDALYNYAMEKLTPVIKKLVTKPISAHITFDLEREHQRAQMILKAGDGYSLNADFISTDMYASVDGLVEKVEAQLKKHKELLKEHKSPRKLNRLGRLAKQVNQLTHEAENERIDAAEIVKYEAARLNHRQDATS